MGRKLLGLVAKRAELEAFAAEHALTAPLALEQGFAFLALGDDDLDALVPPPSSRAQAGFAQWNDELRSVLERSTRVGGIRELLYLESDSFGGTTRQGVVLVRDGRVVRGPDSGGRGIVDGALRVLGVRVVAPALDAFESVGLERVRIPEDDA